MSSELYPLRTLHLFAGAGGGILGDILLGHRCVCAVEIEPYCQQVLSARQEDGILPWFPIFDDVRSFDGKPWRGSVDVVSGGFPCQDISAAGKGAGIEGERSGMWKEMARIIGEVRPRYVLVENSPVLTSRGLGVVLGDLAALGYDAEWGVLGAVHAGAPHNRERIWILGTERSGQLPYAKYERIGRREQQPQGTKEPASQHPIGHVANGNLCGRLHGQIAEQPAEGRFDAQREPEPSGEDVADATDGRPQEAQTDAIEDGQTDARPIASGELQRRLSGCSWWSTEPRLGRNVDGLAENMDRP